MSAAAVEHPTDMVPPVEAAPEEPAPPAATHMPPWIPRLLLLCAFTVAGSYAVWWLVVRLRGLLVILLVSLFLSFALEPAVNFLARRGWRRGLATAVVFLAGMILVGLLVGLMVPVVVDQVTKLVEHLPDYINDLGRFTKRFGLDLSTESITDRLQNLDSSVRQFATNAAGNVFDVGAAIVGYLFQFLTVLLFTFFIVADGPRLRNAVCSTMPPRRQREVLRAWDIAIDKTGGYIYSRSLLAAISAVFAWVFFLVLGVPFAIALAVWFGVVSQFIPVVGTYIAAALPVLLALIVDPVKALWVIGYVLVYQQIENYVFAPKITSKTMQLHPAVAFGAVIAGGSVVGPVGALLALPAAAIIQAFASTYIHRHDVVDSDLVEEAGEPKRSRGRSAWARLRKLRKTGSAGSSPDTS